MKITYANIVIADTETKHCSDFSHPHARSIQSVPTVRARSASNFARENRTNTVSFTINQEHESLVDAEKFATLHADQLPSEGQFLFDFEDGTGAAKAELINAKFQGAQSSYKGKSTRTDYTFIGDEIK
jgi:hypothetical protein